VPRGQEGARKAGLGRCDARPGSISPRRAVQRGLAVANLQLEKDRGLRETPTHRTAYAG